MTGRRIASAALAIALLASTAPAALANHQGPRDGSRHKYGDMVEWDMTFPVVGQYRYHDSFWAGRGNGLHHAQDVMADKMVPVVAANAGTIIRINGSSVSGSTGPSHRCCSMAIRHDDGWETVYIHLNNDTPGTDDGQGWGIAPGIAVGQRVNAGQHIGWVGDSGNAEYGAPHLHFEVWTDEKIAVNPFNAMRVAEGRAPAAVAAQCTVASAGDLSSLMDASSLLREGARGDAVLALQRFLKAIGAPVGTVDGVYGPNTASAVRHFQTTRGLTVDGIVGSQSRAEISALNSILPATSALAATSRTLRPGDRGADVKNLQQLLHVAGNSPGTADGVYGPMTEAAVSAFQQGRDITVDGKVGPQTRSTLSAFLGLDGITPCT
ncbi:MAG TPA: peptidoglycan-binding protein [Acidimicrobiia bacterium]|nr:peptidoglycan-binding protein [Acidimicrobiia bacterium]